MMRVTLLIATMMVETAASTSTLITVQIANVITKKIVLLGLLRLWLAMVSVMIRLTMLTAAMMVETAVPASTSTLITVLIAIVIFLKIAFLGLFRMWLAMVSVMMKLTMSTAIMMEETAVDTMLTLTFALTVDAISTRLVLLVLIL